MSGGKDEGQEKTSEPTPQRLKKAREDGDVPKSTDVTTAAAYVALLLVFALGAVTVGKGSGGALYRFIADPDRTADRVFASGGIGHARALVESALVALSPLFLVPMAFTLVALFAQQAFVFAPSKVAFKASRVSIVSNAGQKFGISGLVEFGKSVFKLVAIAAALFMLLSFATDRYIVMPTLPGKALPAMLYREGMLLLLAATVIVGAIAVFDYFWRAFDHRRKLRMSHQEIKEESKESEGDPHMKGERQRRAREIATNKMMQDVPGADVIIVNPTHYAVALHWSREPGSAPVCVAKGVDAIAARIREIAAENSVPIFSDPPTARLIHATVDIGHEIAPDHYAAVVAAIRFAEDMRQRQRGRFLRT